MTGVEVLEIPVNVENAKKYSRVTPDFGVFAQKTIDVLKQARRVHTDGEIRKGALKHGREQCSAEAFARNIRYQKCGALFIHLEHIEVISANRLARRIDSTDRQVRKIAKTAGQKSLLNIAGYAQFPFDALPFKLAL